MSATLTAAVFPPLLVGVNVTTIVQFPAAATVPPLSGQVPALVRAKLLALAPVRVMLLTVRGALPVFDSVTVLGALVVFTFCLLKVRLVGDKLTAAAPLTDWATAADALPVKLASPPYVAVSVLDPGVLKVNEQLPAPALSGPLQVSPVLAFTVTVPVGEPLPVTLKPTATACPTLEGLGVLEAITVVLPSFTAVVDWLAVAEA